MAHFPSLYQSVSFDNSPGVPRFVAVSPAESPRIFSPHFSSSSPYSVQLTSDRFKLSSIASPWMMNTPHVYPAPESWDNPHSVDDTNDDRPRKRRKYIAKAWSVWKGSHSRWSPNEIVK